MVSFFFSLFSFTLLHLLVWHVDQIINTIDLSIFEEVLITVISTYSIEKSAYIPTSAYQPWISPVIRSYLSSTLSMSSSTLSTSLVCLSWRRVSSGIVTFGNSLLRMLSVLLFVLLSLPLGPLSIITRLSGREWIFDRALTHWCGYFGGLNTN